MDEIEYIKFSNKELSERQVIMAHLGYLEKYRNYLMLNGKDKTDILGMNKYAVTFYSLTSNDYSKYPKLNAGDIDNIEMMHEIMNRYQLSPKNLTHKEYVFINYFMSRYIDVTGIGNSNREVKDPGKAILNNR